MTVEVAPLILLLGPPVLVWLLRRTRAWWIPGIAVIGCGIELLATNDHETIGGLAYAFENIQQMIGIAVVLYGLCWVLLARWLRRRAIAESRTESLSAARSDNHPR